MSTLGLFGGSFDPVHYGHLRIAAAFATHFRLDCVRFIPTANPPHRTNLLTAASDRLAMPQLALAGDARFTIDERELRRGSTAYTFDTLLEIQQEQVGQPFVWLIGADSFASLERWHRWQELFDMACLAVATRPGIDLTRWQHSLPASLLRQVSPRIQPLSVTPQVEAGTIHFLPTPPLAISSTQIRARLADGLSVRHLLPDAVIDYAERRLLYRNAGQPGG